MTKSQRLNYRTDLTLKVLYESRIYFFDQVEETKINCCRQLRLARQLNTALTSTLH